MLIAPNAIGQPDYGLLLAAAFVCSKACSSPIWRSPRTRLLLRQPMP